MSNVGSILTKSTAFSLFALLSLSPASAQVSDPTGEALRRERERQEEETRRQREEAPDIHTKALAPEPYELPTETPCFTLREIKIEGDPKNRFGLDAREYLGKCVGHEGLRVIANRFLAELLDQGYVTTRIALPEQDLSQGTLTLLVIPGIVRDIHYAAPVRGTWKTAFPIRPGDTVNVRDIDQGLEQWKRVPSQDIDVKLMPTDRVGESDIVLTVKREKPLRLSLSAENSGVKSTGKYQGSGTVSFDNPAGLNDLVSASFSHNLDLGPKHESMGGSLTYSLPYGYSTFDLSSSLSTYRQTVSGETESFEYSGLSAGLALGAERVIHRNQVSKTTASAKLSKSWSRTRLGDVEVKVQRRSVTSGELGLRHRRYLGRVVLDLGLGYRKGLPLFAEPDPVGKITTRYDLGLADFSVATPVEIGVPLRLSLSGRAQFSPDRLLASDQFAIGSQATVRGFSGESSLAAERGFLARSELGLPLDKIGQTYYVGVDYGHVYGPSSWALPGWQLAGAIVGLRGAHSVVFYDLGFGFPLSKPRELHTDTPTITFRITGQI